MVGNKPEGSVGATPVPGMAGRFCCGGMETVGLGIVVFDATTLSRADPVNDNAPEAVALAEICTSPPTAANEPTFTVTCSSSAWPAGRSPTSHVEPRSAGQTVNFGAPMERAEATLACTLVPVAAALVLHTQMAKVAVRPAFTSPELEKDSTRTQSCEVLLAGGDFVGELGVGVGLGDVWVGVGVGVGVGVDELADGDDDELPDGEGDCAPDPDVLGLDDGLGLAEWLTDGEVLGDADLLLLAERLGEADGLLRPDLPGAAVGLPLSADLLGVADALVRPDPPGDAEADADTLALSVAGPITAAVSAAFFGTDGHKE
jgi:hypothetical protein